jgi:hypothetical protein
VQASDRWHIRKNRCNKALAAVRSQRPCWATTNPPRPGGVREQTNRERRHAVHDPLGKGVGLRDRRAADPAVPVKQLFREIRELGCTGSLNLLHRYLTQGRAEGDRPVIPPRRLARLLLTRPGNLPGVLGILDRGAGGGHEVLDPPGEVRHRVGVPLLVRDDVVPRDRLAVHDERVVDELGHAVKIMSVERSDVAPEEFVQFGVRHDCLPVAPDRVVYADGDDVRRRFARPARTGDERGGPSGDPRSGAPLSGPAQIWVSPPST